MVVSFFQEKKGDTVIAAPGDTNPGDVIVYESEL